MILTAMVAMLVASLAVPDAFDEYGVIFGVAYFVVRLLQVLLYALVTGRTLETRQAILRLAPGFLGKVWRTLGLLVTGAESFLYPFSDRL